MMKRPCASLGISVSALPSPKMMVDKVASAFPQIRISILFLICPFRILASGRWVAKNKWMPKAHPAGQSSKDSFRFFRYFLCVLWSFRPYPAFPQPRRTLQRFLETPGSPFPCTPEGCAHREPDSPFCDVPVLQQQTTTPPVYPRPSQRHERRAAMRRMLFILIFSSFLCAFPHYSTAGRRLSIPLPVDSAPRHGI